MHVNAYIFAELISLIYSCLGELLVNVKIAPFQLSKTF